VAVALRRQPVEPRTAVTSALSAAEVQRLYALAELFEVDGLGEHTAPYAVVVEVAGVAGGVVGDFTGPMGRPMPLELWSCVLGKVDTRDPISDVLVAAVESYRREAPRYWRNLHPSHHPNPSTDPERKAPS
jgi:hypothetical protein